MGTADITLTKNGVSVTIGTVEVSEEYSNRLIKIPAFQSFQKQDEGARDEKVIDLLRVSHTIQARGHITPTASKTAKEVYTDLITIFKGAGAGGSDGGTPVTVTYTTSPDSPLSMYIEKMVIIEKASDYDPSSDAYEKANYQDVAKYDIQLTLVEGVKP